MKKFLLYSLILLSISAFGQRTSNLNIFTEDGQKFTLMINGQQKNATPQSNVRIEGLNPTNYKLKILMEDPSLGIVERNLPLEPSIEYSFRLKLKKNGDNVQSLRKFGRTLENTATNNGAYETVDGDISDKYKLSFVSQFDLPSNNAVAARPQQSPPPQSQPAPAQNRQHVSTSSTTTTTNTVASPGGISMNINVNGLGTNVSANETHYTETTTTTTSHGNNHIHSMGHEPAAPAHYVMEGYNGPIGCPWPMSNADFNSAKSSVSSKSFDDSKLTVAKQILNSNCMMSQQVKDIMTTFSFEDSKLDFAKYAYGYTYDLGNFYKVNDAFDFESTIDELNSYINSK